MPRYRFKPRPVPPGYPNAWGVIETPRTLEVGDLCPVIHPGEWVIAERVDARDDSTDIDGDIYVELRNQQVDPADPLGDSS